MVTVACFTVASPPAAEELVSKGVQVMMKLELHHAGATSPTTSGALSINNNSFAFQTLISEHNTHTHHRPRQSRQNRTGTPDQLNYAPVSYTHLDVYKRQHKLIF